MVGRAAHGSCQGVHSEGPVGGRGPGLPVGEEALALLVRVKLVAGVGDACEGEHGRGSKPTEFGEGNGAEGVATRRSCGSVAGVIATGKLAVKLVGAVDKGVAGRISTTAGRISTSRCRRRVTEESRSQGLLPTD